MKIYFSRQKLFQNLRRRLSLTNLPEVEEALTLAPSVWPITSIDNIVREWDIKKEQLDLTGALGIIMPSFFPVPPGKLYTIYWLWRNATVGATTPYLVDADGDSIGLGANTTTGGIVDLMGKALVLPEGWGLGYEDTGNGGDGAAWMMCYLSIEDVD